MWPNVAEIGRCDILSKAVRGIMLDWDSLRVVLSIHRHGGLAGAARDLRLSRPTLSRQLARAESDLNCRLFDRRQGRLVATEAGMIVIRDAEAIERRLMGMQDAVRSIDNAMSGPIRISLPQHLLPYALADVLTEFHATYPDIMLHVSITDEMADFAAGNVDVVFRAEENPKPSLWGRRLMPLTLYYYAHRMLLERFGSDDTSLADMPGLPLIVHDGVVSTSEDEMMRFFPNGRVVAHSNNLEASVAFVTRGMGIARLPELVGRELPGIVRVGDYRSPSQRSLWVLTHKDLRSVARIERFVDFIADNVSVPGPICRG